jgi:predicted N-acyltransferase
MNISIVDSLEDVPAAQWNRLAGSSNPFIRYEFLAALERHGCVGRDYGWIPQYILVHDQGRLVGAAPMYLKDNSYGEFVFDWSWAHAYERSGLEYYPKLVIATPYTPATGTRLLTENGPEANSIADQLIGAATEHARSLGLSSVHWLFTSEANTKQLENHGLMRRTGCQFHWTNPGYRDFTDFLSTFTAQKRKKVNRERRRVIEAGLEIEILSGADISESQWHTFHRFYENTFYIKGGMPTLHLPFFREIGQTMAENVVLVMVKHDGRYVAGAFNMRGEDTLYGRHWGCRADFHSLHFEACYYQGIDYCINHGLKRFEPGAQGEHKVGRGFYPTPTYSAHWISHSAFASAINEFLTRERSGMTQYISELNEHLPYKNRQHETRPSL